MKIKDSYSRQKAGTVGSNIMIFEHLLDNAFFLLAWALATKLAPRDLKSQYSTKKYPAEWKFWVNHNLEMFFRDILAYITLIQTLMSAFGYNNL